jgi:hypothetical protein
MTSLDVAREKPTSNHSSQFLCGPLASGYTCAPCRRFSPFATDPVVEFGWSGASQPARRRGGGQCRAPPWVGQAKTAGPGCRCAACPRRAERREGAVGCPVPDLYGRHPLPVNGYRAYIATRSQPHVRYWNPCPLLFRATMPEDPSRARHRCEPLKHLERMSL